MRINFKKARGILSFLGGFFAASAAQLSFAADFPEKPIQLVVPFAAGGSIDIFARILSEPLQRQLKTPILVVNKPGGGGLLGAQLVKFAPADGYTLLMGNDSTLTIPNFIKTDMDMQKDLLPVAMTSESTFFFFVSAKAPANSITEFIAYAKANPGKMNMATILNSNLYLEYVRFVQLNGIKVPMIPYNGIAPILTAFLRDEVQAFIGTPAGLVEQVRAGGIRALAVGGDKPNFALPNVPLATASGNPHNYDSWRTIHVTFAPANTPKSTVVTLSNALVSAASQPAVQTQMRANGADAAPLPWNEIAPIAAGIIKSSKETALAAGIKPE